MRVEKQTGVYAQKPRLKMPSYLYFLSGSFLDIFAHWKDILANQLVLILLSTIVGFLSGIFSPDRDDF